MGDQCNYEFTIDDLCLFKKNSDVILEKIKDNLFK